MTRPLLPPEVLIVDDNAINTELVSFLLGAAGLRVACAADAEQALLRLAGQRPVVCVSIQRPRGRLRGSCEVGHRPAESS